MGNHSAICPHCGDDRRYTYPCCPVACREEEDRRRDFRADQAARQALFERHEIEFIVCEPDNTVVVNTASVARFLVALELLSPAS